MSENITRELIIQWAYDDVVINLYESGDDGDAAVFQSAVIEVLGARGLLELAADSKCPSRMYFARLLSNSFLWMFRRGVNLPFHFSRARGIMSRDEYRQEVMRREGEIYELCLILDSMRLLMIRRFSLYISRFLILGMTNVKVVLDFIMSVCLSWILNYLISNADFWCAGFSC